MKKRLLAAAAALLLLASQSVCAAADWGYDNYDYNYGYEDYNYYGDQGWTDNTWTDNTWTDNTGTDDGTQTDEGTVTDVTPDSSSESDSKPDTSNNVPVNVVLAQSAIQNKLFTVDVKLDTKSKITGIDLTILYDPNVLKLTGSVVNKKAASKQGKGVAAETETGTIQYQFNDPNGSEWKESFLTLSFEVVDPLEKSSAIYTKVNSILDEYATPLSYRADGTIVQIAGAVEYDAKDDESMYTELRVAKSDTPLTLDSLGFQNVASVQIDDKKLASTDNKSITTLGIGLTNMSVEFTDGTKKYYRLVVAESAPKAVVPITGNTEVPEADKAVTEVGSISAAPEAAEEQAKPADTGLTKTETRNKSKVKYLIIYILVLVALIAVIVEFFVFYGNPYAKTAAILRQRKEREQQYDPNEGFNGAPLSVPDRRGDHDGYGNAADDGYGYSDGYDDGSYAQDGYDYSYDDAAQDGYEGYAENGEYNEDSFEYQQDGEPDYYDEGDAYDGYSEESGYTYDPTTVEGYDGFVSDDTPDSVPDDDMEYLTDDDIILADDEESDFDGEIVPRKDEITPDDITGHEDLDYDEDFEEFDD